jgi:hypothetical protein
VGMFATKFYFVFLLVLLPLIGLLENFFINSTPSTFVVKSKFDLPIFEVINPREPWYVIRYDPPFFQKVTNANFLFLMWEPETVPEWEHEYWTYYRAITYVWIPLLSPFFILIYSFWVLLLWIKNILVSYLEDWILTFFL